MTKTRSRLGKLCLISPICVVLLADRAVAQDIPEIVYDPSIPNWIVDRFAGNTRAGDIFYQGAAREIGGLQRPEAVVATPEGIYIAAHEETADHPFLYIVKNDLLRIVMDREGAMEGPLELCQGGYPVWNAHDNSLYLTGPYCIRKVVIDPDNSRRVEVVAGTCGTAGSTDGPASSATLQEYRGMAAAQDGSIYWMERKALRKLSNGTISTPPLTRSDPPLWNIANLRNNHLSAGENANTLYINDYYNTYSGYGIVKVDLTTNTVEKIIGAESGNNNHGNETDGPALTHVGFPGGARGTYSLFYNAIFLGGADTWRYRWYQLDGDGWVRTIFGSLRPETEQQLFGLSELNSLGMSGEQFRFSGSNIHPNFKGVDSTGGVYVGATADLSGLWRAYEQNVGSPATPIGTPDLGGNSRIYMTLVDSSGHQTIAPLEISPSSTGVQSNAKAAYDNGTYLVVWADQRNDADFDILGARISSDGVVLDASPLQIGTGPRTQAMPDVAADDQGFMVVWGGFEGTELLPHIYAARVSQDGTVGSASIIADGATPQIAWNAIEAKHFVLYSSSFKDKGTRPTFNWLLMDSNKSVDPETVSGQWYWNPSRDQTQRSVTAIGSDGWTFVTDGPSTNLWRRTYGAQRAINIAPDGGAADTPEQPANFNNYPKTRNENWMDFSHDTPDQWPWGSNAVAANGQYAVAVWNRYHVGGTNGFALFNGDLYASRIDRWNPVEETAVPVSTDSMTERNPVLAGNGLGNMLVVYEKQIAGNPQIVARALTITEQIAVGNEVPIVSSEGVQRGFPGIAYGGGAADTYLVVWQEGWYGENFSNAPVESPDPVIPEPGEDPEPEPAEDPENLVDDGRHPIVADGCGCRHAPGAGAEGGYLLLLGLLAVGRMLARRRGQS